MSTRYSVNSLLSLTLLLACPILASTGGYGITVSGERLEFVPQPQRGYAVKLAERTGDITAVSGIAILDDEDARPVRGLDRRGVWTVENEGPAGHNEDRIRSLRAGGQVAYAAPLFSSNGETIAIIPEIVVRVKPGTEMEELQRLCETAGCTIRKRMEFTEWEYLLEVLGSDAEAVFVAVEWLNRCPEVEWAAPNTVFKPEYGGQIDLSYRALSGQMHAQDSNDIPDVSGVIPDDEYFPSQWHLHNTGQSGGTPGADIRAPEAWEITTGDPNIVISVVDHGVDLSHTDLVGNLVAGYDFWDDDDLPEPGHGTLWGEDPHGTACAGLFAATGNNGIGVTGVTWGCKIMPGRVDISGDMPTNEADIATTLRWAASNGADILSNSWGFYGPLPIIHAAIVDITKPGGIGRDGVGCTVVFCAGNNTSFIWWPAVYPEVIAVGATTHNDLRAGFSCRGPALDIAAPGDDVWTTDITGPLGYSFYGFFLPLDYYASFSGTSAATAVTAGVAGLILSIEPNLTPEDVQHFLERSAKDLGDPGWDKYYGWGRLDARAALDMVLAKRADLNDDWIVDEEDQAILMEAMDTNDLAADIAPAAKRDGVVDANDLELLTQYLGTVVPEPGLYAHWKLDETEGDAARESVNHRDGTVYGGPIWQPQAGVAGGALELDGVDDHVLTTYERDLSGSPFSVHLWVKGGAPGQVILSQQESVNWLMADASRSALRTESNGSDPLSGTLSSESIVTDGDWHRVGLVWDGSGRTLYVDDVVAAEDALEGLEKSSGQLIIGCGKDITPGTFWSGLIDDVRIYNRVARP